MDEAARRAGIPIEEVYQRVKDLSGQVDTLNYELRLISQKALKNSLTKLTELAAGDAREGKDFESTDLQAATVLAKIAMDAIRICRNGAAPRDGDKTPQDLFDATDPWKLKDIE